MFAIFTDTSSNLPSEFLTKNDIKAIPLTYLLDGEEHSGITNPDEFDGHDYYTKIRHASEVQTSQIPPQRYIDSFSPALEAGCDILFIGMSSGISGSFNAASIAAEQLRADFPDRKICLVDTLAASLGEGIYVMDAVKLRDDGVDVEKAAEIIEDNKKNMYQVVVVEDLKYLHRTGRVSAKAAIIGSVLNIKPILKGDPAGTLVVIDKVSGKKNGIKYLAEKYKELVVNAEEQVVGIVHADAPEDADLLEKLINEINPPKELIKITYEPVTGSHVGPGTVALFYKGGADVREH
ncbi:MAG: DegV family protein [Lachnospiraceae bacterium]|nr:DegV family protein [Lachnospiraceae bacterium]